MHAFRWLTLALLLPASAFAQSEVSSVSDPIRPNRAPLALTEEVPAIFHLGLGDPAALFVNPARAARARQRFVYGTLRADGSPEYPVSFAGLFGSRDRRWLIAVENGVALDGNERTQTTTFEMLDSDLTREEVTQFSNEAESVLTSTRARLLFVSRTDFGGVAFGLFGGYRHTSSELVETRDVERTLRQTTSFSEVTDVRFDEERLRRDFRLDGYGVGAEVAFAGRTWDLAASVSYQGRADDLVSDVTDNRDETTEEDFEDGRRVVFISRTNVENRTSVEGSPSAVDFELVGALRTGRDQEDYLFGTVAGTFGSGSVEADFRSATSFFTRRDEDGVITETMNGTEVGGGEETDLATRATEVSLGYVFARKRRGVTVLAAVNPVGTFAHTEAVAISGFSPSPLPSRQETDATTLALHLPLFVRFNVSKRLEAFGGGTYAYAYNRTETESSPIPLGDEPDLSNIFEETLERTTEQFSSDGRLYAGAVMTFRSGLTAQAVFRGDLAEIDRWTVSLGYRF
ncbi:MAG: hypothetical protein AAGI91_08200 [Bacteroidota bacterium]